MLPSLTFSRRFCIWLFLAIIWLPVSGFGQESTDSVEVHVRLFNEARALQDSGRWKESLPVLKKVLKEKKDHWEAYNLTALAEMRLGDYKDALKAVGKAEQIAPLNYESVKLRGIIHYLNRSFTESKNALDTAAYLAKEESIDDADLHLYRAQLMFKGKAYKDALATCETVLDLKPRMWEAMLLKGEIRFEMKEYRYAIRDLTEAIDHMKAENIEYNAYKLRAKSKFELADYKGAVTDWDVYLEAFPKEEEALISRGAAKISINDNSGAIADLDAAISLNSKNPVSWCYRGVAKGGNKSFEAAMKDLDQSIKLKFDWPVAYVNRAAIKMALRDKRGACKDLERADSLGSETAYRLIEQYCK